MVEGDRRTVLPLRRTRIPSHNHSPATEPIDLQALLAFHYNYRLVGISVNLRSPMLRRFFIDQQHYAFIAVVVTAVFWAMDVKFNLGPVVVYSYCLGNLVTPVLRLAAPLYETRPPLQRFFIFFGVLLVGTAPAYLISTALVWRFAPPDPPQALGHLLRHGWKFPVLVCLLWASLKYLYDTTRARLETRTRELERTVELLGDVEPKQHSTQPPPRASRCST